MVEKKVRVTNSIGLHARPASLVVSKAKEFECTIELMKDGKCCNAKSIMGVLSMAAKLGDELLLRAAGTDEEKAVEELAALIESGCGEH